MPFHLPFRSLLLPAMALLATPSLAQQCASLPAGAIAWYPGERHADDLAGFFNGTFDSGSYVTAAVGEGFAISASTFVGTSTNNSEMRAVRNSFSYELWVRPTRALGPCAQAASANCSTNNLAWAIFPIHGDAGTPPEEAGLGAGVGVAVGTDGVCVGEHAAFHVTCNARLNVAIPNNAMTHVVVVVENTTPRIYLNGTLAHTGVASAKQFVFASWQVLGSGFTLGKYEGDLDEVTIYDRALTNPEIAGLAAAGSAGKCRPDCPFQRTADAWQAAQVTSNTPILSSNPNGLFGATNVSPEPDSLLFADGLADGTVHAVEWETAAPMTLAGFGLAAFHDSAVNTQRAFRRVRIQAREIGGAFATVYDQPIVVPYEPGGRDLDRCVNLRPVRAQQFRAEFTQDGPPGFSGPRVVELDGVGLPDLVFRDGFEAP